MTTTPDQAWLDDYAVLQSAAGLADWRDRTQIEIAGEDRNRFLHNLCTAEIRKLPAGAGCEAFLTNVQGKILAHGLFFSEPDALVLETVPGQSEKILAHLDRYLIREKVTLCDRSLDWAEWLLVGPAADQIVRTLTGAAPPDALLASLPARIETHEVWIRRVDFAGPSGLLIDCRRAAWQRVGELLVQGGARSIAAPAIEARRIEAGFPWYGPDISEKNLPQELARDQRAISFTKGCYLGQETVARIDALGHVNQTLVGVRFDNPAEVTAGLELSAGGSVVGRVTSATWSPLLARPLALAYVRRGSNRPGERLASAAGPAEVVTLPIADAPPERQGA